MAFYLRRSNKKTKQTIPYIYLGNERNEPKKILKGYIGDEEDKPRLFFTEGREITLYRSHERSFYQEDLSHEYFIYEIAHIKYTDEDMTESGSSPYGYDYADPSNKYSVFSDRERSSYLHYNGLTISNKVSRIYLNENSKRIFNGRIESEQIYYCVNQEQLSKIKFDKVKDLSEGFNDVIEEINLDLLGNFNNVENLSGTFWGCNNFIGNSIYAPKAINMCRTYTECENISGKIYIGPNVINAHYCYLHSGRSTISGLQLGKVFVANNNPIDLSYCFSGAKVYGIFCINTYNNARFFTNLEKIFEKRQGTSRINVFMSKSKTSAQLNTYLKQYNIVAAKEKHVLTLDDSGNYYVDIQDSSGKPYNIRFYNYIPDSYIPKE